MFIPIGEVGARRSFPFFNYLLLIANIAVYAWVLRSPQPETVLAGSALIPAQWEIRTLFTSMFLHADLLHLSGNLLFLWIAGDGVESRLGHLSFLVFYLAAGVAGAAAHIMTVTGVAAGVPTVGASGAISGVMGAYLAFFPRSRIRFLVPIFLVTFTAPSWYAIGLWLATQALLGWNEMSGTMTGIAVFAHLGGFAFGFAVAVMLRVFGRGPRREEIGYP